VDDHEQRGRVGLGGQPEAAVGIGPHGERLPPAVAGLLGGRLAGAVDRPPGEAERAVRQRDREGRPGGRRPVGAPDDAPDAGVAAEPDRDLPGAVRLAEPGVIDGR
jgi:hypothetical protein